MNFLLLLCCFILILSLCKFIYRLILSLCKFVYKIIIKTGKEKKYNTKESIDIISYKEENGIVYGYLNQYALDLALYNRAKNRTNNFTAKDQWNDERSKKDVQLKDISTQKHSILYRPFLNGEFVSAGNVILDIGLESITANNYFNKNNISQYETRLCCGIKIFSKYDGYYENKISDNIYNYINLGNTISDGDLLFTIKLSEKPQEIESPIKNIKFNYNILDCDFIKNIPYLSDIWFSKWLVSNYSHVNIGDNIFAISEYKKNPPYDTIVKSPYNGILVQEIQPSIVNGKLSKGTVLCTIYSDISSIIEDRFKYQFKVNKDDFTKKTMINCNFLEEKISTTFYTSLGIRIASYLNLNFEWAEDKCHIVLFYNKKEIKLDKNISFLMLFDDGNVLSLNPETKPSNDVCRLRLSTADMDVLENSLFIKWRINDNEGNLLAQGNNNFCSHIKIVDDNSRNISSIAFQKFIRDFRKVIRENVSLVELDKQDNKVISTNNSCYVYLMIDTINNFHKIGISNNPKYREHTLQSDKPTIELLCAKEYPSRDIATAIESSLHKVYAPKRIRGEWFNLEEADIENIKQTLK